MAYLYLLSIILANILTAMFAPVHLGIFLIPVGTLLIGATFIFRDLVQNKYGKKKTYFLIVVALCISALSSYLLGDSLFVVCASALSFIISETTDTEIYSRLKLAMEYRILYSGLVGGLLDSSIFVLIALSPIFTGILTWPMVPYAVLGQIIFKSIVQFIGVYLVKPYIYRNHSSY